MKVLIFKLMNWRIFFGDMFSTWQDPEDDDDEYEMW